MRLPKHIRRNPFRVLTLIAAFEILFSVGSAAQENPLIGVWLTQDAYPMGAPKGMAFRPDLTGVSFETPYQGLFEVREGDEEDALAWRVLAKMLRDMGFPENGVADGTFTYVLKEDVVTIQFKEMSGLPISADPFSMKISFVDGILRLDAVDDPKQFIVLELVEQD